MRFLPALLLAAILPGCASIPGLNDIPLWQGDPSKLAALGKGASITEVDKSLGRSRILATETFEAGGTPYQFRLYDWVERSVHKRTVCNPACTMQVDHIKVPYGIVLVGSESRLYAWGKLDDLVKHTDPAVASTAGKLRLRHLEIKYPRR
jgi:hypothetical protein